VARVLYNGRESLITFNKGTDSPPVMDVDWSIMSMYKKLKYIKGSTHACVMVYYLGGSEIGYMESSLGVLDFLDDRLSPNHIDAQLRLLSGG